MTPPSRTAALRRVGVFVIGARGAVASSVALGVCGMKSGRFDSTGLVTALELFARVPLVDASSLVFGGMEVRRGRLRDAALGLARQGIVPSDVVAAEAGALDAIDERIVPGFLDGPDAQPAHAGEFHAETLTARALAPAEIVARVKKAIAAFRAAADVDSVVVVNLASTEAARSAPESWNAIEGFERDLAAGAPIPASVLHAYAAIDAGCPYVNFTPSLGATPLALDALARARGVPHAGCDGKTGETLVKTALAPMFRDRHLRVLAWEGYNLLGNADGETLSDPAHKASKIQNKDEALRRLLGNGPDLHTRVGIDYVPSLGDWKTAWDFIHFQGFLGTRMTLQFTWTGSDSALAAPLVIDLVRLADLAQRRGESGAMTHTAAFFKSPVGSTESDFHRQHRLLEQYARDAGA